ncbi:hypothetical protein V8J88_22335 [Massilia sp. W12]|uniref:hypothetical protein n=1 Tax=Massilia sp. W12 TaxID=3126507 RepID=UPI0030D04D60
MKHKKLSNFHYALALRTLKYQLRCDFFSLSYFILITAGGFSPVSSQSRLENRSENLPDGDRFADFASSAAGLFSKQAPKIARSTVFAVDFFSVRQAAKQASATPMPASHACQQDEDAQAAQDANPGIHLTAGDSAGGAKRCGPIAWPDLNAFFMRWIYEFFDTGFESAAGL